MNSDWVPERVIMNLISTIFLTLSTALSPPVTLCCVNELLQGLFQTHHAAEIRVNLL